MACRYYYKYITNGQWRHSTSSPAERDERGNVNNVIVIGDTASVRPSVQPQKKVSPFLKSSIWPKNCELVLNFKMFLLRNDFSI